jgi:hypothetical protein
MTPYEPGNTPDMIETPLLSMINNQLWKSVLIPVYSAELSIDP